MSNASGHFGIFLIFPDFGERRVHGVQVGGEEEQVGGSLK